MLGAASAAGCAVAGRDISDVVQALLDGEAFWSLLPPSLISAVNSANVTIFVVDETFGFRLDHKVAETFTTGPECSIYKIDAGMGRWIFGPAQVDEVLAIGDRILRSLSAAEVVRVKGRFAGQ